MATKTNVNCAVFGVIFRNRVLRLDAGLRAAQLLALVIHSQRGLACRPLKVLCGSKREVRIG